MSLVHHSAGLVFQEARGESAVLRLMDHSSLDGSAGVSSDGDVAEPTYRALWQSTSVGHGNLDPGATRTHASVDSLE